MQTIAEAAATPMVRRQRRSLNRGKDETTEISNHVTGAEAKVNSEYRGPAGTAPPRPDRVQLYTPMGGYVYNPVNPNNAPPSWFDLDDTERDGQGSLTPGGGNYPGAPAVGVDRETFDAEVDQNDRDFDPNTGNDDDDSEEVGNETNRTRRRRFRRNLGSVTTMYQSRGGSREGMRGKLI